MKIIRYLGTDGEIRHAARLPDGFLYDITGDLYADWRVTGRRADIRQALAPVAPTAIFGVACNYRCHGAEANAGVPEYPVVFAKTLNSVQPPGSPILLPAFLRADEVDYECALAVIIGRTCKNVRPDQALGFVLGYTAANDISARDWQLTRGGGRWARGKNWDTFCLLGPCLVTPECIPNPNALSIKTTLTDGEGNREAARSCSTSDMLFDVPTLIAFLSASATLLPGTVILTGASHSVGMARRPPRWLRPGDVVTLEVEKIGLLTSTVEAES